MAYKRKICVFLIGKKWVDFISRQRFCDTESHHNVAEIGGVCANAIVARMSTANSKKICFIVIGSARTRF
jgi:hypothetical protein